MAGPYLRFDPDGELRPLAEADAAELFALTDRSRERLGCWLPWVDVVRTREDSAAFIRAAQKQAQAGEGFQFALRTGGRLAGVIGQHGLNRDQRIIDFGYWLGDGFEGRGLVSGGCRALLRHTFATLPVERVRLRAAPGNLRSRAVAERLAFRWVGVQRRAERVGDRWVDHCHYELSLEDWVRLQLPAGAAPRAGAQAAVAATTAVDDALDAEMADYYQARAEEYDDWYERRGAYAARPGHPEWFDALARLATVVCRFAQGLSPGAVVCDLGCGTGRWTAMLAERRDLRVVGLDRSTAMLGQARARLRRLDLSARLLAGDALEPPLGAASCHAALCGFLFDHLDDHQRARLLEGLGRTLRPDGCALFLANRREPRHVADVELQQRVLGDGRRFRVRKALFDAEGLRRALAPLGAATTGEAGAPFVWALVRRGHGADAPGRVTAAG